MVFVLTGPESSGKIVIRQINIVINDLKEENRAFHVSLEVHNTCYYIKGSEKFYCIETFSILIQDNNAPNLGGG